MNILAIETSCDDTCVAVIRASGKKKPFFKILSNIVSSQEKIHRKWGGVYPALAKREHQKNLAGILKKALKKAGLLRILKQFPKSRFQKIKEILARENYLGKELEKFFKKYQKPKIDAIAVTVGPGLEPCLWVGVNFAKALSYYWNLPIVPVNHIEAHILANWLLPISPHSQFSISNFQKIFPAICLVVSGGHTQLILMKDFGNYKILGETRDDAAGECFDKTAKILGLSYPGGPAIAKIAFSQKIRGELFSIKLPRPMIHTKDYDFSFSGLKTAVLYNFKKQPNKIRASQKYIREMSAEIQQAIIDVLIKKTIKAAKNYKAKSIILGGGVSANNELRKQFKLKINRLKLGVNFLVPPKKLSTDNGAMVALAGYYQWLRGKNKKWTDIKADANLKV